MIESTKNQCANAIGNPYQGARKKALCVCSAGMLRSPTMAALLAEDYNLNTRAVGTCDQFSLIPLSEALLLWADEIYVVAEEEQEVRRCMKELGLDKPVWVMHIKDDYDAFSSELFMQIDRSMKNINTLRQFEG